MHCHVHPENQAKHKETKKQKPKTEPNTNRTQTHKNKSKQTKKQHKPPSSDVFIPSFTLGHFTMTHHPIPFIHSIGFLCITEFIHFAFQFKWV